MEEEKKELSKEMIQLVNLTYQFSRIEKILEILVSANPLLIPIMKEKMPQVDEHAFSFTQKKFPNIKMSKKS